MKTQNVYIIMSFGKESDRLAGYLPAESYGRSMCFVELKSKL